MSDDALVDTPDHDDSISQPVYMVPEGTVLVTGTNEVKQTFYGDTLRGDVHYASHGNVLSIHWRSWRYETRN